MWNEEYPTYIEVPEGYWTLTTTVDTDKDEVDIYWHHHED